MRTQTKKWLRYIHLMIFIDKLEFINLVTFVLIALASGVMILIGRYLGEKRNDRIGKLIGNAVAIALYHEYSA